MCGSLAAAGCAATAAGAQARRPHGATLAAALTACLRYCGAGASELPRRWRERTASPSARGGARQLMLSCADVEFIRLAGNAKAVALARAVAGRRCVRVCSNAAAAATAAAAVPPALRAAAVGAKAAMTTLCVPTVDALEHLLEGLPGALPLLHAHAAGAPLSEPQVAGGAPGACPSPPAGVVPPAQELQLSFMLQEVLPAPVAGGLRGRGGAAIADSDVAARRAAVHMCSALMALLPLRSVSTLLVKDAPLARVAVGALCDTLRAPGCGIHTLVLNEAGLNSDAVVQLCNAVAGNARWGSSNLTCELVPGSCIVEEIACHRQA
eukprot:352359-Chlamydomonas_euryale.AAC.1